MTRILAFLKLAQAFATVATVIYVFLTWQQLRLLRRQATTTFEDSPTEQYRRIMENIPIEIWLGLELKALDEVRRNRCRDAIYRYIDLSNDQAFLHNMKRATDEAWNQWSDGIKLNMKLVAFEEVWEEVREKCPASFNELRALLA
jgi:hypothetical protein